MSKLRSGGLFSKEDKSDCKTSCRADSVSNCKKYCSKAINTTHAKEKLAKLKKEILQLEADSRLARSRAKERKTDSKDAVSKGFEGLYKSEPKAVIFGGRKRKSRKVSKSRRKHTRKRGGKTWSEYLWTKPNLDGCIQSCSNEIHASCDKVCENASIKTAEEKIQHDIEKSEETIAQLKLDIADWNLAKF